MRVNSFTSPLQCCLEWLLTPLPTQGSPHHSGKSFHAPGDAPARALGGECWDLLSFIACQPVQTLPGQWEFTTWILQPGITFWALRSNAMTLFSFSQNCNGHKWFGEHLTLFLSLARFASICFLMFWLSRRVWGRPLAHRYPLQKQKEMLLWIKSETEIEEINVWLSQNLPLWLWAGCMICLRFF